MKNLKILILLFLVVGGLTSFLLPALVAAGTTTMSLSQTHVIEGSSMTITLSLTGYPTSEKFNFTIQVTDPTNNNSTKTKIVTLGSTGAGTLLFAYPSEFNAATSLNGTYAVRILPSPATNATAGTFPITPSYFGVGLTGQVVYQRTLTVNIQATGYKPNNLTSVNVTFGGTPVLGFPHSTRATSSGVVTDSWKIPSGTSIGTYLISIAGNSTKLLADKQNITVIPAILGITGLEAATNAGAPQTTFVRGDKVYAVFNATYPDGSFVTTGGGPVEIRFPNGTIATTLSAAYNSTKKEFLTSAGYPFAINAPTGSWSLRIIFNTMLDAYSNLGPTTTVTATFSLAPLTLKTSITSLKTSYNRTDTFSVNASVSYPTSDIFTGSSGVVFANLTNGAKTIPAPALNLTYTGGKWVGSITIPPDYPTGSATLQVSARDKFDNTGSNSTLQITITPTTVIVRQVPFIINGTSFKPLETFVIEINATYFNNQTIVPGPNGLGRITFNLPQGKSISIGLTLKNGLLAGQYTIGEYDPLGAWNLTINIGRLNDGNGNLNSKGFLGPTITIIPVQLTFYSQFITSPGNVTITGDKITVGVDFRFPNSTRVQNLVVNGTVLVGGQNMTYTFNLDPGTQKFIAKIDTTGWAPSTYKMNVTAYVADYRGSHVVMIIVQPTPFLIGPVFGGILILMILAFGILEYSRHRRTEA